MSARPSNAERNAVILARHNAGEPLSEIGRDYGLTRERARQIVAALGGVPKRTTVAERNAEIVATIKANDFTIEQARAHFGRNVYDIGKKAGHTFRREFLYTSPEIVALAEKVRGGMSIRAAAGNVRSVEARIGAYCKKAGIVSKAHSRWLPICDRATIITEMRAEGCSWLQIEVAVSKAEGRHVNYHALANWCQNNLGSLPPSPHRTRSQRKPRVRAPRQSVERAPRPKPKVIVASNAKEAARLNYGKAPASAIAFVHGVSRNSIIGHWFRLRRQGELA